MSPISGGHVGGQATAMMCIPFIRLTPQRLKHGTMSFQIVSNQMAFCNCQQATYEYEFIIVQLQADCIIFIGFFLFFFSPAGLANYRI